MLFFIKIYIFLNVLVRKFGHLFILIILNILNLILNGKYTCLKDLFEFVTTTIF